MIAILNDENGPTIILQKEFRPPAGGMCVELPAGEATPEVS